MKLSNFKDYNLFAFLLQKLFYSINYNQLIKITFNTRIMGNQCECVDKKAEYQFIESSPPPRRLSKTTKKTTKINRFCKNCLLKYTIKPNHNKLEPYPSAIKNSELGTTFDLSQIRQSLLDEHQISSSSYGSSIQGTILISVPSDQSPVVLQQSFLCDICHQITENGILIQTTPVQGKIAIQSQQKLNVGVLSCNNRIKFTHSCILDD